MPKGCSRSVSGFGGARNLKDVTCDTNARIFGSVRHRQKKVMGWISVILATLLLLLWGLSTSSASAQAVYGSIGGTVIDASGGGVANANVTITDLDRNITHTVQTNATGNYNLSHLIIGKYRVQVEAPGFKTSVADVNVDVDTLQTVDMTLQPGDIKQTITVTDEMPLLKTERTDLSTTLTEMQVTELPTFGRNFSELLLLTPGAIQFNWNDTSTENPQGGIAVNVNGQQFVGVGAILDGTDNRDMMYGNMLIVPNLDAVVQMKVTSADYDAEFGQVSAAVVTTSTKSGTNDWHGSAFWYRRTDATMARDPFAQSQADPVTGKFIPSTHWNQFGGSLGGPILKNKAFFFMDYQGTRAKDGGSAEARVPTEAERNGDFSAWLTGDPATSVQVFNPYNGTGGIADPTLRTAFAGNKIPSNLISSAAQNLLKNIPLPNLNVTDPTALNYAGGASDTFNGDAFDVRVDYFFTDKLRMFDRYTFTQFLKSAPGLFGGVAGGPQLNPIGYTGTGDTRPQSNSFGFDYSLKPTLLTDFRFGWYRQRIFVNPLVNGDYASQAGAPGLNIPTDPTTDNMPHFQIQGNGGFDFGNGLYNNCNCPLIEKMQQFQFVNNWTWTKGNHTIKFGPDIRRLQNLRVPSDQHRSGEIYFSPTVTEGPGSDGSITGGLGLASFLLGEVNSFQRYVSSSLDAGERQWRTFYYGEDTWRVNSKLTVNFGLRWEIYFPQTVTGKDQGGWLDIHTGEMLVAGENGVPLNGNVQNSFKNLAPRVGVAYQVNPKTVVRIGYGRSFDVGMFGSIFGHSVTQNLPVLGTQSMQPSNNWQSVFNLAQGPPLVDPATVLDGQPKGPTGSPLYPNGFRAWVYPDRMILPTVDAWNATIQRQITPTLSVEAAYVGNKGTHIFVGEGPAYDINAPTLVGYGTLSTDQRRPFFAPYGWNVPMPCFCNTGNNHYNALQIKGEKRFSQGFTILTHYTYSHAKNNDSPYYLYDSNLFYGRPDWQRNNVFVFTGIWELPFGKGKSILRDASTPLNYVVGGWQLSGNLNWMSGQGFNVSYQACGADNDVGVCLPNKVGSTGVSDQNQTHWFAAATEVLNTNGQTSGPWQRPQAGTLGDAGRNQLIGPAWFDADISVIKSFPIREQLKAQFRAEIYNVFNHANLGNPNGCVDCLGQGGGGWINNLASNATMRRMQFAIRFEF
jgi:Carboxypeptidase regulatory-like domain/TonB dependent receptor